MNVSNRIAMSIRSSRTIGKEFGIVSGFFDLIDSFSPKRFYFGKRINFRRYETNKKLLKNTYFEDVKHFLDISYTEAISRSCCIWIFWWQGLENAPDVVKNCIASIEKNKKNHRVVIIDKDNVRKYADIPEFIFEKVEKKDITLTHFSDILRAQLLYQHGGIWMDSTLFMREPFNEEIYNYPVYTIHHGQRSNYHVCKGKWTGFFWASGKGNPLFGFLSQAFYKYWSEHNCLLCYLLIDCFIAIAYENNRYIKEAIDQIPNNNEKTLDFERFMSTEYNEKLMEELCKNTYLHKLTYKIVINTQDNSMYSKLLYILLGVDSCDK